MKPVKYIPLALLVVCAAACGANKPGVNPSAYDSQEGGAPQVMPIDQALERPHDYRSMGRPTAQLIPQAVIYRTNGDYDSLVPYQMNEAGNQILSYPAPSDLTLAQMPVKLEGGWLLDRRGGVGYNTVFTTWTYPQYMSLLQAPTPVELMEHTLRGARVTAVEQLPFSIYNVTPALADSVIRARGLAQ